MSFVKVKFRSLEYDVYNVNNSRKLVPPKRMLFDESTIISFDV